MNAPSYEIVYTENSETRYRGNLVSVQVRRWQMFDYEDMHDDVLIESRVIVDGETVIDKLEAVNCNGSGYSNAHFQRIGIAKFDALLAEHPTLRPASPTQPTRPTPIGRPSKAEA